MEKRYFTRSLAALLVAAAGLALVSGCAHDQPFAPDDVVAPAAANNVLDALRDAYESMSIEAYANLLHPDYRFIFAGRGKAPFDRDDDLASTGRMFSGIDQKNSAGGDAPAVGSIVFERLEILEGWERVAPGEIDWSDESGVMRALIAYRFVLRLKNGHVLSPSGRQVVYAVPVRTEDWDGALYWRWQLLGQRDL